MCEEKVDAGLKILEELVSWPDAVLETQVKTYLVNSQEDLVYCRRVDWPTCPNPPKWEDLSKYADEYDEKGNSVQLQKYREAVRQEKKQRLDAPVRPPCSSTHGVCKKCHDGTNKNKAIPLNLELS